MAGSGSRKFNCPRAIRTLPNAMASRPFTCWIRRQSTPWRNWSGRSRRRPGGIVANENASSGLMPVHGGYRNLKSFQVAQLVYDVTTRFCDRYISKRSRTQDQMVQAARSGVQNIAEGSQAAGTSKKTELKLTNVARASLEELLLDYQDFLRQRGLAQWAPEHPALKRFKARRCATLEEVRAWVQEERKRARTNTDGHGRTRGRPGA